MLGPQYKVCPACRISADIHAQRCANCGHVFRTQFSPTQAFTPANQPVRPGAIQVTPGNHPIWLVALLSFICLGGWAGCLVNKQYLKGILVYLIGGSVACVVTGGLFFPVLYIVSAVDAMRIAIKLDRGQVPVYDWTFF